MLKRMARRALHVFREMSRPFEPYEKALRVGEGTARFFFGTRQASDWYDPLKPYTRLEYDWVVKNLDLRNRKIVDGGSHHGQYSVVFAVASQGSADIVAVDPIGSNCLLTEINLRLNDATATIRRGALAAAGGTVRVSQQENAKIVGSGGQPVDAFPLHELAPDAEIVKLDIEGAEFDVLPASIDEMGQVDAWIVELHPGTARNPDTIVRLFQARGYEIRWVNRQRNAVEAYELGTEWPSHSTVFAVRS